MLYFFVHPDRRFSLNFFWNLARPSHDPKRHLDLDHFSETQIMRNFFQVSV